jgi:two-component system, LytTR family, sensor kinase
MGVQPHLSRGKGKEGLDWSRVWLGLAGLWACFAVLGTWLNYEFLLARGHPVSWAQSVRMNLTAYGIWAVILTPMVLFLCARLPLTRRNLFKLVPAHLLAIAVTTCADVLIKALLHRQVFPYLPPISFAPRVREYLLSQTEADIQIYILVAVIGYVVAYYAELRSQEWHAAQLENNLIRAELQVLRMQLQPHFLFNTLHSVAALVPTNPRAAQKMICSLGDLLRMSLAGEDLQEVTLKRELEFVQHYLDIQKIRFQDRLTTEFIIADDVLDAKVPYLLLQPLVENAIKHGITGRPGSGRIEIHAAMEDDGVCVRVANDKLVSPEVPEQERLGIGLENVRNRLRILYGARAKLSAQQLPGRRFQVEVRIPFQGASQPNWQVRPSVPGAGVLESTR